MAKYGINRLTLIGNLGKDPDFRYLDTGIAFASLWLACTERIPTGEGAYQDRTEWVSVNLWRQQAEIASKYCRKGMTVCIEGRVRTRTYDAPDGTKRSVTEVEGSRLVLLDRPADMPANSPAAQPVSQVSAQMPAHTPAALPTTQSSPDVNITDDLPF